MDNSFDQFDKLLWISHMIFAGTSQRDTQLTRVGRVGANDLSILGNGSKIFIRQVCKINRD
jgi:hypothetical protein